MKIKTRLRFNTLFSVAIVLLIGLMLFNSSQQVNRVIRENRTINQVVRAVFGLNILINDYLFDQSDRAKKQWHLRYNSLSKLIRNFDLNTRKDSLLLEEIEGHNGILKSIFSQLTTEYKSMDDNEEAIFRKAELRERLADKLITKSQAMVSAAEQLLESTSQRVISIQQDTSLFVMILIVIAMLLIALNSMYMGRSILKPILNLQKGTQIIGKGNLDHKLELPIENEIGELSKEFDLMTEKLKATTVSRDKLENEITERNKAEEQVMASLKEKEVLLGEIHHRVKNNMQVMISLLRLQADKIEDKKYADLFKEGEDRIRAMAIIHEKLYQSRDFVQIDFGEYVKSLVDGMFISHGADTNKIRLNIDIKDVSFDLENAIPCGLIINELVSNSLKHAFPQGRNGKINIDLRSKNEDKFELTVNDDGIGVPEDLDIRNIDTMGLSLVQVLAEHQLDGKITLNRTEGTQFNINFKRAAYKPRI